MNCPLCNIMLVALDIDLFHIYTCMDCSIKYSFVSYIWWHKGDPTYGDRVYILGDSWKDTVDIFLDRISVYTQPYSLPTKELIDLYSKYLLLL